MIVPSYHTNDDGDLVFEISHLSENKQESKKIWFDRKRYYNWITINPLNNHMVRYECECQDFLINRGKSTPCKHLNKSFDFIKLLGVKNEAEM